MNESVATEEAVPTAASTAVAESPTQRLAFDKDTGAGDTGVPEFLKKARKAKPAVEDRDPDEEAPASVDNPVKSGDDLQSLAELSIEQLKQQQADLERKILEKQQAERADVIAQIAHVMGTYNISLENLVDALGGIKLKRKGTKAKAKYRDPATGVTWSGRGKEPLWIRGATDRTPFEI